MSFVQMSYSDIKTYLTRAWSGFRQRELVIRGERAIAVLFDEGGHIGALVFTSVGAGAETAAGKGADAIRVGFYNFKNNKPLMTGKFPIVKRTTGWKDSLDDRIQEHMDSYLDKEAYWTSRVQ
jgi:hypothetical protein